jgi:Family of unknown function (DUF5641)
VELETLTTQIEFALNSRPLTHTYQNEKLSYITPNDLLLLKPTVKTDLNPPNHLMEEYSMRLRLIQRIYKSFWTRWVEDYLVTLHPRRKWRREIENKFKSNDVVIVRNAIWEPHR